MHVLGPIFLTLGTLIPLSPAKIEDQAHIRKIMERVKTPEDLADLYRALDRIHIENQRRYEQQLPKKPTAPMTPPKKP